MLWVENDQRTIPVEHRPSWASCFKNVGCRFAVCGKGLVKFSLITEDLWCIFNRQVFFKFYDKWKNWKVGIAICYFRTDWKIWRIICCVIYRGVAKNWSFREFVDYTKGQMTISFFRRAVCDIKLTYETEYIDLVDHIVTVP